MVRFSQAWVFVKLLNGITDVLPSRLSQQHFFFPYNFSQPSLARLSCAIVFHHVPLLFCQSSSK